MGTPSGPWPLTPSFLRSSMLSTHPNHLFNQPGSSFHFLINPNPLITFHSKRFFFFHSSYSPLPPFLPPRPSYLWSVRAMLVISAVDGPLQRRAATLSAGERGTEGEREHGNCSALNFYRSVGDGRPVIYDIEVNQVIKA